MSYSGEAKNRRINTNLKKYCYNPQFYINPCRSRKFFTPPQPSPYQGPGVRNSQMIEDCYILIIKSRSSPSGHGSAVSLLYSIRLKTEERIRWLKARHYAAEDLARNTLEINLRVDGKSSNRLLRWEI
jgi:hypothetical protein